MVALSIQASAALMTRHGQLDEGPSVQIYVLNLDGRRDKCECMKSQLAASPYPVTRFSAISPATLHDVCPHMQNPTMRAHAEPGTMSLVCSNLQVWKHAQKTPTDFVLMFEDDTILGDGFWHKLNSFLRGGCREFDYVMVDPWKTHGDSLVDNEPIAGCAPNDGFMLTKLSIGHNGAHMQLIRHAALKTMIERAESNLAQESTPDKFAFGAARHGYPLRIAAGVAGIATQAHKIGKVYGNFSLPEQCDESVWRDEDRKMAYAGAKDLLAHEQWPFVDYHCV